MPKKVAATGANTKKAAKRPPYSSRETTTKKPVQIWLTEEQREAIAKAAESEFRPVATFAVFHLWRIAKEINRKNSQKTD